jgi:4-amino-4-deoxy-L-arabinose transferase-like glycosyltransferase
MVLKQKNVLVILGILLLATGFKTYLVGMGSIQLNADEAIVGLMARHILAGERPIFFYGQAYMGSLDAYLVAIGFFVFGSAGWVIRLVQILLYTITILTTVLIGWLGLKSITTGLLAGVFMAIPTVNVTLYTTASLGGYGEALLIGNLILVGVLLLYQQPQIIDKTILILLLTGVSMGAGFWANGLTLIYSVPGACAIAWYFWTHRKNSRIAASLIALFAILIGFLIGAFPWFRFAFSQGWNSLTQELLGSAVAIERTSRMVQIWNHFVNLSVLGGTVILGLRPPWEVRWLAMPFMPFVLMFWIAAAVFFMQQIWKKNEKGITYRLLAGVCAVLFAGFIFTSFGVDPSGRYFVPLVTPMALVGAEMVQRIPGRKIFSILILPVILIFNLWGSLDCAFRFPPGITTQFDPVTTIDHRYDAELIQFLTSHHEFTGYSNYWVSYPLAFQSGERLIYTPRLPYHMDLRYTLRDDRYAAYDDRVNSSRTTAYITTRNPALDAEIRSRMTKLGVTWNEKQIGDYHIYYGLSRPVRPEEIGMGSGDILIGGNQND